jgi:sulfotransferase family protein
MAEQTASLQPPHARVSDRRLPDFFVVGHAKSGTSALNRMLARHPQIFMPHSKEPWYFASELRERTPPRPEGTPGTLQEYAALFFAARPDQRVGEASPQYLWSRTAAGRIAAARPDARIVAIVREPASFLRSLHSQFVESYIETEADFRKALALEGARREGREIPRYTYWPLMLRYSDHVRYVEQLRRFRDLFGAERMLVLIYDDFRADNEATVREVLRFVGADDTAAIEPADVNPTVQVRSPRLHQLLHAVSVGAGPASLAVKGALKAVLPQRLRRDAIRAARERFVYADPQPPDEHLMAELRGRYRGEVAALGDYLDRDLLKLWGYDDID